MRIIHLTDLHVGRVGEDTYGVDVRKNVRDVLKVSKELQPDLLVVTGDLCFNEGDKKVYAWVKEQLDETGIPYFVIAGNHDDSAMLSEVFHYDAHLHGNELFYEKNLGGQLALFADTSSYAISQQQLDWLTERLDNYKDKPVLLFIHHPPLPSFDHYMEKHHRLKNREELSPILTAHPYPVWTFCGHFHSEQILQKGTCTTFITPAIFFQIDPFSGPFKVDSYQIGFRVIELAGEQIKTHLHWMSGHIKAKKQS